MQTKFLWTQHLLAVPIFHMSFIPTIIESNLNLS
jgi:hypothetical protein